MPAVPPSCVPPPPYQITVITTKKLMNTNMFKNMNAILRIQQITTKAISRRTKFRYYVIFMDAKL